VVRTLGFLIVRWGLGFVGLGPAPDDKDVEIAVPRYQLLVLPRQAARPATRQPMAQALLRYPIWAHGGPGGPAAFGRPWRCLAAKTPPRANSPGVRR
jgi:hypothetical protein